jgi:LCP family protein required for cell wall assembly
VNIPGYDWGPTLVGGRYTTLRRAGMLALVGMLALALVAGVGVFTLYRVAEGNLERMEMTGLAEKEARDGPLNVLVVGSDSREGMSREEIAELRLGLFEGGRSDAVFLVSITPDNEDAAVISFPRDLIVLDDGDERKLTDTFEEGPSHVVDVLQENTGVPIHHYVEVSIPGFLNAVEALGSVEICFDEPLRDQKSNSDFDEGCHELDAQEALAFVRARQTARGDFDRIERHQKFMRAALQRMVETRTLMDPAKLFRVVDRVSRNVTTDSGLDGDEIRRLAQELRGLAGGDVPMTVLPSYPIERYTGSYVTAYEPGATALYRALVAGDAIPPRGTRAERTETRVEVWHAGDPEEADYITRTLFWSQFDAVPGWKGTLTPGRTTVYAVPGSEERAEWVAAVLGAESRRLPVSATTSSRTDVLVVVGSGHEMSGDTTDVRMLNR